jgi:hypothetical protein
MPMAQGQFWVQFAPGYGNGVLLMHTPVDVFVAPWMGHAMLQHQGMQQAFHSHHYQHQGQVVFQQVPACPLALPPAECGGATEELPSDEGSEREGSLLSDPAIAAWGSRGSSRGGSEEQPGEDVGASIPATVVRPGETNEEAEQRRSAFILLLRGSAQVPSAAVAVAAVHEGKAARAAVPATKAAPAHMHRRSTCSQRPRLVRAPLFVSVLR